MKQFILVIILILLFIILAYSYKRYYRRYEGITLSKIEDAIRDVGSFGTQIGDLFNEVDDALVEVGNLGNDITNLGNDIADAMEYPVQIVADIPNQVSGVFDQAENLIIGVFDDVFDEIMGVVNDLGSFTTDIFDQIFSALGEAWDIIDDIPNQVVDLAETIFLDYIPRLFSKIGELFEEYILSPLFEFFEGILGIFDVIGDVFIQMFSMMMRIPTCIPIYMFDTSIEMLKTFLPKEVKKQLRNMYPYTLEPLSEAIIYFNMNVIVPFIKLLGLSISKKNMEYLNLDFAGKCYDFGAMGAIIEYMIDFFQLVFETLGTLFELMISGISHSIGAVTEIFT